MANPLAIEPHAAGSEEADGAGAAIDIGALRSCVELTLDVTDVVGTFAGEQGLTVYVETSLSGLGGWQEVGAFDLLREARPLGILLAKCRRYVRVRWTVTGSDSPSFTFSVAGLAHVLYATPEDMERAIRAAAIEDISPTDRARHLLDASSNADDALGNSFTLPLTAWGPSLRKVVAERAVYYAMMARGFDPESTADQLILLAGGIVTADGRKTAAQKWFDDVASGRIKPDGIVDSTPETYEGSGFVISDPPRA